VIHYLASRDNQVDSKNDSVITRYSFEEQLILSFKITNAKLHGSYSYERQVLQ